MQRPHAGDRLAFLAHTRLLRPGEGGPGSPKLGPALARSWAGLGLTELSATAQAVKS